MGKTRSSGGPCQLGIVFQGLGEEYDDEQALISLKSPRQIMFFVFFF